MFNAHVNHLGYQQQGDLEQGEGDNIVDEVAMRALLQRGDGCGGHASSKTKATVVAVSGALLLGAGLLFGDRWTTARITVVALGSAMSLGGRYWWGQVE